MEKAKGVPLESVYDELDISGRYEIVQTIARYQVA